MIDPSADGAGHAATGSARGGGPVAVIGVP